MVANLAKRAEKVRARAVEPNIDNMLKITNDGRKLALDQRMIDPMLPDDPDSKVNACVDNVYRILEEHADTKATQLVFCDLSTPKNDGSFNIYDDIRGSSPSEVFLPNRYDLSTKRPRTHRKRSCLQRYEAAKSVCYSALPRKWEQAQMSKTALSPFTIWIVRGDPLTLNKDRGVSKGKAICS